MKKIVLVTIPRYAPTEHLGISILSQYLADPSINIELFDANFDLYEQYKHSNIWSKFEQWGILQEEIKPGVFPELETLVKSWASHIVSLAPTHVGISVFTHESRNWCQLLCYNIRLLNPAVKIILGGKGLNNIGQAQADFGQCCLDWALCDYYFNGEAEFELKKLLLDQPCKVNNYDNYILNSDLDPTVTDARTIAPQYTYKSTWYHHDGNLDSHIVEVKPTEYKLQSTRGCVKTCSFCDVHLLRPKFSYRSAQSLVDEMISAIETQGAKFFLFADDMINGNNKQFMQWNLLLANYLENNNITDVTWSGQFGIKKQQSTPTELFSLMSRTGGSPNIGVDHFSDSVLSHMGKLYQCSDIYFHFSQCALNNIRHSNILLVTNYPTETASDFELQKQGLTWLSQYARDIDLLDLGSGCAIPTGSKLETMSGMSMGKSRLDWHYENNPLLNTDEKILRRQTLETTANELGFVVKKPKTQWMRINQWLHV